RGHRGHGGGARRAHGRHRPQAQGRDHPCPLARVVLGAPGMGERVDERRRRRPGARIGRPSAAARYLDVERDRERTNAARVATVVEPVLFWVRHGSRRASMREHQRLFIGGDWVEPAGVVGAIVPWNVPQFVIMSKLAPALIAGCTIVVKPSPETPLDAFLMADLLNEAGIPKGVVSVIPAGREVGEHLVRHLGVDKIAFTGSTAAGRRIASICGEQLKRVSLELGGKSAAIILDDADLAATVEGLKMASLMNNGQACVAQTRILASKSRYNEVVDAVTAMVGALAV